MMQGLVTCVLILGLVSPCFCRWNVATKHSYHVMNNVGTKNTFNMMNYGAHGDGISDDSQALLTAWKSTCEAQGEATLVIPPNQTFMVKDINLSGPCTATNIDIQIQGKIVAPDMGSWGRDKLTLITISNVNGLTIEGTEGLIDGHGSTWWKNCPTCTRPKLLSFHACNNLVVSYLKIMNSPRAHISVNGCENVTFSHININAPSDSPNTDGIDISASKNIFIRDSTIATGDDCIAINGGSSFINATRVACGPGHGISIGSLGKNGAHEIVEEIYVQNCSFTNTTNGARIKTWPGGSGYARKITFEEITLVGAGNPIIIDQYYGTNSPKSHWQSKDENAVRVDGVTYRNFHGTSTDNMAITIDCSKLGCFNIVMDHINIVNSKPGIQTHASCTNGHKVVSRFVNPSVSCLNK